MAFPEIKKAPLSASKHNLVNYQDTYTLFNWQQAQQRITGNDQGLNIAYEALDATLQLETSGIDAEVLDLRCLRPLDRETILDSVRRTHKALIVDESCKSGGMSAEVSASIAELGLWHLDVPINRICSAEVPIPYAYHSEQASLPQVAKIIAVAKQMMEPSDQAMRDPL